MDRLSARKRLIKVGAELLVNYSSHSPRCSTTEIAKAAETTQPLIHYHFVNKDGLLFEVMNYLFNHDREGWEKVYEREKLDMSSFVQKLNQEVSVSHE